MHIHRGSLCELGQLGFLWLDVKVDGKKKHVSQLTSSSLYLKPKFRTVLMYFKFLFISLLLFFYIKFNGSVRLDGSGGSAVC